MVPATSEFYPYRHPLSLHDALPISQIGAVVTVSSSGSSCRIGRKGLAMVVASRMAMASSRYGWLCQKLRPGTCIMGFCMARSEEHTSELQSLMRISYAVYCLKKKIQYKPKMHSEIQSS